MTGNTDNLAAPDGAGALHPGQLFHVGFVVRDMDAAMAELGRDLQLNWKGGKPQSMRLQISGEEREIEMRIAHSVQGPPYLELIEARPNTPWDVNGTIVQHHLCYWSADSAAVCARLEAAGYRRALGASGSGGGYFVSPSGTYIEIINVALRDQLAGWISKPSKR
jgi:hypothetical protein